MDANMKTPLQRALATVMQALSEAEGNALKGAGGMKVEIEAQGEKPEAPKPPCPECETGVCAEHISEEDMEGISSMYA